MDDEWQVKDDDDERCAHHCPGHSPHSPALASMPAGPALPRDAPAIPWAFSEPPKAIGRSVSYAGRLAGCLAGCPAGCPAGWLLSAERETPGNGLDLASLEPCLATVVDLTSYTLPPLRPPRWVSATFTGDGRRGVGGAGATGAPSPDANPPTQEETIGFLGILSRRSMITFKTWSILSGCSETCSHRFSEAIFIQNPFVGC